MGAMNILGIRPQYPLALKAAMALLLIMGVLLAGAGAVYSQSGVSPTAAKPAQSASGLPVVKVIAGRNGHVMTADGSRYFVGAVLPTGHTIVEIQRTAVIVSKDGKRSQFDF